ncbi:MAG TPA: DinB family protein [Flavisolibacter sp.]|nr:DinB family protein [Flavisolibacter sp.]
MTMEDKAQFLRSRFVPLLESLPTEARPAWGKMTVQQMIEHFADSVRIASGKVLHADVLTPQEHLDKYRSFLESEKPFRENTVNPLLPEVPAPVRNPSKDEALKELKEEVDFFFSVFEKNNLQVTRNPVFGDLNYEQNIQLLYKHALHHLKQFGLTINAAINT